MNKSTDLFIKKLSLTLSNVESDANKHSVLETMSKNWTLIEMLKESFLELELNEMKFVLEEVLKMPESDSVFILLTGDLSDNLPEGDYLSIANDVRFHKFF